MDMRQYIDIIEEAEKQSLMEDKKHPDKYFKGLSKKEKEKRKKEFERNAKKDDDDDSAYEPMTGDDGEDTKESKYTKEYNKKFGESVEAVKNKAEETGIPYKYLKKVYDRGMAAWKSGHRPNTTPQQWALARINSFATGGKTRSTADKDIWDDYKGNKKNESVDLKESYRLKDLVTISTNMDDADVYVVRRGSEDKVGEPSKEHIPHAYGIKVTDTETLDAGYLYYVLKYLHSSGYWKDKTHGSLRLVNIRKDDLENIPLG